MKCLEVIGPVMTDPKEIKNGRRFAVGAGRGKDQGLVSVSIFKGLNDRVGEYIKKGSVVHVRGLPTTGLGKDGKTIYLGVLANELTFINTMRKKKEEGEETEEDTNSDAPF